MFKTKNLGFQNSLVYNDIEILEGKINFIQGPSGSGKSTLLKLFNKTENSSSGEIIYKGEHLSTYESISLRKEVKLISQTTFLFAGTIRENFETFHNYCQCNTPLTDDFMCKFLNLTSADFSLNSNCDNLSGGEKQRIYIAICLSMEASVIMLDEPTSALDSVLSNKVMENITQYIKENSKTLIVISHDNSLTEKFTEHTILLKGRN